MSYSTKIKVYRSTNLNAPVIDTANGSILRVLDGCLIDGFPVGSISSITVTGKVAVVTFTTDHKLETGQTIRITGADQAEYNTDVFILAVPSTTTIQFELDTEPTVTTPTGTITARIPSLGWEKPFSSSHPTSGGRAAYRSSNTLSPSRPYLRIVDEPDTNITVATLTSRYAKVAIVEDMTSIDSFSANQAPYDPSLPLKNWESVNGTTESTSYAGWSRWLFHTSSDFYSSDISSIGASVLSTKPWCLVGTSDYFYLFIATGAGVQYTPYGFGAFDSFLPNDTSNTFLASFYDYSVVSGARYRGAGSSLYGNNTEKLLLQRDYLQTKSVSCSLTSIHISDTTQSGSSDYVSNTGALGLVPFAPVFIKESIIRGKMPLLHWIFNVRPYSNHQIIEKDNIYYMAIVSVVSSGGGSSQFLLKTGEKIVT